MVALKAPTSQCQESLSMLSIFGFCHIALLQDFQAAAAAAAADTFGLPDLGRRHLEARAGVKCKELQGKFLAKSLKIPNKRLSNQSRAILRCQ